MKKIDQQRLEFLQKINFTDWRKDNPHKLGCRYVRETFMLYHDVMFEYHESVILNCIELFVKNWWFRIIHPNLQMDVKLYSQILSTQRAVYQINWDGCALAIISEIRDKMAWSLDHCKQ